MTEFLKTLLFLNVQGSVVIVALLLLKGVIRKAFPGFWQRNLWVIAMVFMLLPVWKLVPVQSVEPILIPLDDVLTSEYEELFQTDWAEGETNVTDTDEVANEVLGARNTVSLWKSVLFVWALGVLAFLLLSFGSYFTYLFKMKRRSAVISDTEALEAVREKLKIRRKIRVRKVNISQPPLLTGCFFPVVYMPDEELCDEEERMVYLHELTHFKHMDLPIKWFACIVNSINWFNPFIYLVIKNLNEACEIYCDEAVTKGMDDEGKRIYMNTILNLVEKK